MERVTGPDQARDFAHLVELPGCLDCGKTATVRLRNGLNAPIGDYCKPHGDRALKVFKAGRP